MNSFINYPSPPYTTSPKPAAHNRPSPPRKQKAMAHRPTTTASDNDPDAYELRIAAGIQLVKTQAISIRAAAKHVNVSHETLRRRCQGAASRREFHAQLRALSPLEEDAVEQMVATVGSAAGVVTAGFVCGLANEVRKMRPAPAGAAGAGEVASGEMKELGVSWTAGFRRRHEAVNTIMARSAAAARTTATNVDPLTGAVTRSAVDQFYSDVQAGFQAHGITPGNVYNLVELGYYFQNAAAPQLVCAKRADALKLHSPGMVPGHAPLAASLSSLDAVCADGSIIPPLLIVKSNSATNLVSRPASTATAMSEYAALGCTLDGRANAALFYDWLQYAFEPATAPKTHTSNNSREGPGYRALFLDASPVLFSAQVLQFAVDHRIVFFLFPPQPSHHSHNTQSQNESMQPLDCGLLQEYAHTVNQVSRAIPLVNASTGRIAWDGWFRVLQSARLSSWQSDAVIEAWRSVGLVPFAARPSTSISRRSSLTPSFSQVPRSPPSPPAKTHFASAPELHTPAPAVLPSKSSSDSSCFPFQSQDTDSSQITSTELLSLLNSTTSHLCTHLLPLPSHCRQALTTFLSTCPPLYYSDGQSATETELALLAQVAEECWAAIESAVRAVVERGERNQEWVLERMGMVGGEEMLEL